MSVTADDTEPVSPGPAVARTASPTSPADPRQPEDAIPAVQMDGKAVLASVDDGTRLAADDANAAGKEADEVNGEVPAAVNSQSNDTQAVGGSASASDDESGSGSSGSGWSGSDSDIEGDSEDEDCTYNQA